METGIRLAVIRQPDGIVEIVNVLAAQNFRNDPLKYRRTNMCYFAVNKDVICFVKFKQQLNEVKNNREFEALTKEIEIMELEIVAAQKRINEANVSIEAKNAMIDQTQSLIDNGNKELELKKEELVMIVQETELEEKALSDERDEASTLLEERLMKAYSRIRKNAKNGVAIAPIIRSSCGGCFGKIPPQMQADIKQHLKITACEYCGRILVDASITGIQVEVEAEADKPRRRLKKRLGS